MRLTINFKDDILDSLEEAARKQGKSVERLIVDNLETLASLNPKDNNIVLKGSQVSAISDALGGKTLQSGDELVRAVKECFRVGLTAGAEFNLSIEDLQAIKEFYIGHESFMTFNEYITDFLGDALSLHLYGSVRPRIAYK